MNYKNKNSTLHLITVLFFVFFFTTVITINNLFKWWINKKVHTCYLNYENILSFLFYLFSSNKFILKPVFSIFKFKNVMSNHKMISRISKKIHLWEKILREHDKCIQTCKLMKLSRFNSPQIPHSLRYIYISNNNNITLSMVLENFNFSFIFPLRIKYVKVK